MPRIGLVVDDMFFVSKITAEAERAGSRVERIKSPADLDRMASDPPALVIIDLNSNRLDPIQTIEALKSSAELGSVPVVGFVSHVQVDLIRRAEAAGCDHVLPRSRFTQLLGEIVSGNLTSLR